MRKGGGACSGRETMRMVLPLLFELSATALLLLPSPGMPRRAVSSRQQLAPDGGAKAGRGGSVKKKLNRK
jgi:hypothetical protein